MVERFALTSGPRDAELAFVGEAPGENEAVTGIPFIGTAGTHLTMMCRAAGLDRDSAFIANTFNARPPKNMIEAFYVNRRDLPSGYDLPQIARGKFIDPALRGELDRLADELNTVRPRVIVCLGNTALWALTGLSGINKHRGVVMRYRPGPAPVKLDYSPKVIATLHPAAIARQYSEFVVAVKDLQKAKHHLGFDELPMTPRRLLINPTIEELEEWVEAAEREWPADRPMSTDTETAREQITCVGFGDKLNAVVIPFYDSQAESADLLHYWPTPELEARAWRCVQRLNRLGCPKVGQNLLYDLQVELYSCNLAIRNPKFDTMLMHHAMQPELRKSLGFLGSIHLDEPAWKHLRENAKKDIDTLKKDD